MRVRVALLFVVGVAVGCATSDDSTDDTGCPPGTIQFGDECRTPMCTSDAMCGAGERCDMRTGMCIQIVVDSGVVEEDVGVTVDAGVEDTGVEEPDAGAGPLSSVPLQEVPLIITKGAQVTFRIGMQNDGTSNWPDDRFRLVSANEPADLWGATEVAIAPGFEVEPGRFFVFNIDVQAPTTPGTYSSRWRMEEIGAGVFGNTAITTNISVTSCGDGTLDRNEGEECDDANLEIGDGCSDLCRLESFEIDLASTSSGAERVFLPENPADALSAVAAGELFMDGQVQIAVGDRGNVPGALLRNRAGRVHVYTVGPGFFALRQSTAVPNQAAVAIVGARSNDGLGGGRNAGIIVSDVTRDGRDDLILTAQGADGPMGDRADCGEIYVFEGGATLASETMIDLSDPMPSPALRARIIGPRMGSQIRLLTVGDVTGDGAADLIIGAPNESPVGTDSGVVYVVRGGLDLTGEVDLALQPQMAIVATINGERPGDMLGQRTAAIGDIVGDAMPDLIVAAAAHGQPGIPLQGAVWAISGPISGTYNLNQTDYDSKIVGRINDRIGTSVAVGNVVGSGRVDLVVGNAEYGLDTTSTGLVDVWQGPLTELIYDLEAGAMPTTRIEGTDALDRTGTWVQIGDINGDMFDDFALSISSSDGPSDQRMDAGEVIVIGGAMSLPARINLGAFEPVVRIHGALEGDRIGLWPSSIVFGDLDGDGKSDFCVGAGQSMNGRIDCLITPF